MKTDLSQVCVNRPKITGRVPATTSTRSI